MNLKVISRNVGIALVVSALFMLLSVFVSLANGQDSALAPLLISFTITFAVGGSSSCPGFWPLCSAPFRMPCGAALSPS